MHSAVLDLPPPPPPSLPIVAIFHVDFTRDEFKEVFSSFGKENCSTSIGLLAGEQSLGDWLPDSL